MFERIIEIIIYVISELKNNKSLSDIDLVKLKKLGYTNSEISAAFNWLADKSGKADFTLPSEGSSVSFRILHDAERELFTREAWGELVQYQTLGMLDNEQVEAIIEHALIQTLKRIDKATLKIMVAGILFQKHSYEGNYMLNGNETIN